MLTVSLRFAEFIFNCISFFSKSQNLKSCCGTATLLLELTTARIHTYKSGHVIAPNPAFSSSLLLAHPIRVRSWPAWLLSGNVAAGPGARTTRPKSRLTGWLTSCVGERAPVFNTPICIKHRRIESGFYFGLVLEPRVGRQWLNATYGQEYWLESSGGGLIMEVHWAEVKIKKQKSDLSLCF